MNVSLRFVLTNVYSNMSESRLSLKCPLLSLSVQVRSPSAETLHQTKACNVLFHGFNIMFKPVFTEEPGLPPNRRAQSHEDVLGGRLAATTSFTINRTGKQQEEKLTGEERPEQTPVVLTCVVVLSVLLFYHGVHCRLLSLRYSTKPQHQTTAPNYSTKLQRVFFNSFLNQG